MLFAVLCLGLLSQAELPAGLSDLAVRTPRTSRPAGVDWLVQPVPRRAELVRSADGREVELANGLVRRVWRVVPNGACVALDDLMRGASVLRAVEPEARLVIGGRAFDVGGLVGQPDRAWLAAEWLEDMQADAGAFRLVAVEPRAVEPRLEWKRVRHAAPDAVWPPPGVGLALVFEPPSGAGLDGLSVTVRYELYDGLPVMQKWLEVDNGSGSEVELDRLATELLAVVEHGSTVETRPGVAAPVPDSLHVECDYAFGGMSWRTATHQTVHWLPDPDYSTQVNYLEQTPCLLVVEPERGPDVLVPPGGHFASWRTFELVQDSSERERRGLALRRTYRALAPWVTENPLVLHVISSDPEVVRTAIDQAAECGFEMVSLSFGSGLDMEDESPANLAKFRQLSEYAAQRGVELGGYSLLSSRRIEPDGDNCIHPETGKPGGQTHGFCPALASGWGQSYFRKLGTFFEETGFRQLTHDGSYPGDWDAAARPPLQRGLDDSQWVQWGILTRFYRDLRARGVYLRVPDYYYLSGSSQCGMGYRETNWSLPRAQQVIHTRQNIYDGTWEKTPSMGWMFVPLTQYHGGGAAATIEPLDEHLEHYQRMLQSNLALGVQAAYRGYRLYDSERVRTMVRRNVDWFLAHRDILESDLIHGRRADGRALDWMLHVNPRLPTKGLLAVFNPLPEERRQSVRVNLHYTGLRESARVSVEGGPARTLPLDCDETVTLELSVPAGGLTWCTFE